MNALKLTEEIAADIRARVKSLDFSAVEKISKAKEQNGTFDVIISTEDLDRSGEIVKQSGWELGNYKNNPIVLWGHDYYSLPIGVCTETYETTYHGVPALGAKGVFLSAEINPFAQQVRKLYEFGIKQGQGVGCTTSVGFIPKEFDNENGRLITKAELLEFSFVPVPANQGVGPAEGRALTFDEAKELGLDVVGMRQKGVDFADIRGLIPEKANDTKAPEETVWAAPTLKDFSEKEWDELTLTERQHVASHFAYATDPTLASFDDLKLPYRRASDAAVVLTGLKAAMKALPDTVEAASDRRAVYEHLAGYYKLFGKDAPELSSLKAAENGDECTMDDGTLGILVDDGSGALVCQPTEIKATDTGHNSEKKLLVAVRDEHDRHNGEMDKAFSAFESAEDKKAAMSDLKSATQDEQTMHRAKSIACFRGFEPAEDKAFDKNPHLKSLREEHDAYEAKTAGALDELEQRCMKSVKGEGDDSDDLMSWMTAKMDSYQVAHKKAVSKTAKAMCKAAFGEEDQADEKTLAILKEFLAPHIDAQLLPAVAAKIGAKLSAETKNQIGEAHQFLKAATTVLEGLHGGLADGREEESRSDDTQKGAGDGSRKNGSRPRTTSRSEDPALKAHLQAREIVGGIEAAARNALGKLNAEIRDRSRK